MFCSYSIFNHVVTTFVHQVPRLEFLITPLEQLLLEFPGDMKSVSEFYGQELYILERSVD
jgi:hypothetical protein